MKKSITFFILLLSSITVMALGARCPDLKIKGGECVLVDKNSLLKIFLNNWRASKNIPGVSVAILRKNNSLEVLNSGYRNLKGLQPVRNNTLFRIGSITKNICKCNDS